MHNARAQTTRNEHKGMPSWPLVDHPAFESSAFIDKGTIKKGTHITSTHLTHSNPVSGSRALGPCALSACFGMHALVFWFGMDPPDARTNTCTTKSTNTHTLTMHEKFPGTCPRPMHACTAKDSSWKLSQQAFLGEQSARQIQTHQMHSGEHESK